MMEMHLETSWSHRIKGEFDKQYMQDLNLFLAEEKKAGKTIYPKESEYLQALTLTPFDQVKVVILGQDPYHGPEQAHGLCFSVRFGVRIPPSLVNIYKELKNDLNIAPVNHGCLEHWAKQGVLLLNSVLTVERDQAASHQRKGWETFTDTIIAQLNEYRDNLVFIFWGNYAQKKGQFIDKTRHKVLFSVHPSPLSANRGFFGSKPFSQANTYLTAYGFEPIDWQLPLV